MINAQLGITPPTAASPARLLAVAIQRDTLIAIGRALAEGADGARRLIDALEDLGQVANGTARDGELDAALDDVAHLAALDTAHMDLSPVDVRQLADDAVHAVAIQHGSVTQLPRQQERRAS